MGSLFGTGAGGATGGSNSQYSNQSQSSQINQAYPFLQSILSPTVGTGTQAGSAIANMLGLNGPQGQSTGFQNWQNSTGYQFGLDQGVQSITGNAATQGLLNSGSTLKALQTYGQNYANTQYGNYVNQLQGLLGSGIQAGNTIGSAGNTFNSSSSGSGTTVSTNNPFGSGSPVAGIGQLINKL